MGGTSKGWPSHAILAGEGGTIGKYLAAESRAKRVGIWLAGRLITEANTHAEVELQPLENWHGGVGGLLGGWEVDVTLQEAGRTELLVRMRAEA